MVTETPPGTPNGFGITLKNLFQDFTCKVVYTDKSFKNHSIPQNYVFAHCPNHKSKKLFPLFLLGLIPEWRGNYSSLWLFFFLRGEYDIVYSFLYSLDSLKFARWIASRKKSHLFVHVADHCESFFLNPKFEEIIQSSHKRACIGVNMKKAYQEKFNIDFKVFHNFADADNLPLESIPKLTFSKKKPLNILFIGSIFKHLHHGAVQDLCRAVRELNSEGKPIILSMHGQVQPVDYLDDEIDHISVFHNGEIDSKERFSVMEKHHVFVIPSSFDKSLSGNYSFSIPTKLPELLGSGRPTVIYGPPNMEAYRYCKNLNSGIIIEKKDVKTLKKVFINLLDNYYVEYNKAQSDTTRFKGEIFGYQCKKEFSEFILN